jgi:hypothetical protein
MELKFLHKTIQLEHNYGTRIQLRSVQVYPEKKIMDIKYWQKKIQLEHNYSKGTFRKKNIMDFNYWHMKRQLEYSYSTLIQLWSVKVPENV